MHRVIDLDLALKDKDADGLIFTITVGFEKLGFASDEVAELLRARAVAPGKGASRKNGKARAQYATDPSGDTQSDGDSGAGVEADASERLSAFGRLEVAPS